VISKIIKIPKQLLLGLLGNDNEGPERQSTLLTKAIEKYLKNSVA
jgi:hypothetical protein